MKGSIGIAACLAVGFAAWNLLVSTPQKAYGIDKINERMLELKSIHLIGKNYESDGITSHTFEVFAQRPGFMRVNGVISQDNGITSTSDLIITPTQRIVLDSQNHQAKISPETPVDAQLETEQFLQLQTAMLLGQGKNFQKIGPKTIGTLQTDQYESTLTMPTEKARIEVYLNPNTGLPVRSEFFFTMGNKPERPGAAFDTIEPNVTVPAETFHPDIPKNYQSINAPAFDSGMTAQTDSIKFRIRYIISLDEKHVLALWCRYDLKHPDEDLDFLNPVDGVNDNKTSLDIRGNENSVYHEKLLHADPAPEGFHWRWSLFSTDNPAKSWGQALSISLHSPSGTATDEVIPVKLPPNDLPTVIEKLQRQTLPTDTPDAKVLTLKEIEATK